MVDGEEGKVHPVTAMNLFEVQLFAGMLQTETAIVSFRKFEEQGYHVGYVG